MIENTLLIICATVIILLLIVGVLILFFKNKKISERNRVLQSENKALEGKLNAIELDGIRYNVGAEEDSFLLPYIHKLIHNNESRVIVIDYHEKIKNTPPLKESIRSIEQTAPNHIALFDASKLTGKFLGKTDLLIIGLDSWKKIMETKPSWTVHVPSILILKE